jgi:hypothetical protein
LAANEAEAAKNLHGLINDVEGRLCREKFGDRGFARDAALRGIVLPGRAINQQCGGVYAHGHVGELGLDHLVFRDRFFEGCAGCAAFNGF